MYADARPLPWVQTTNAKPIPKLFPNTNGEAAMDEEVVVALFGLLAKGTKPTIVPPPLPQSIRRPKPILEDKPCMILHFRERPSFPHKLIHTKFNKAEELQLVGGCRGILPITGKLPNNVILDVLIKMHILD
jgi:hypothetical protein